MLIVPVVVLSGATLSAEAAGPWKGRLVDAETGQPLAEAIVFAVWWKRIAGIMHEGQEFHAAAETVTGIDGEFEIPARILFTLIPIARIEGPELIIFRSGYGR